MPAGPPAIIIHRLDQALAAADAARALDTAVTLRSAYGAGGTLGVGWFAALGRLLDERYPDLAVTLVLDCGDETGTALGALRRRITRLRVAAPSDTRAKLAALAAAHGATLDDDERPCLDLGRESDDPAALEQLCRHWLAS